MAFLQCAATAALLTLAAASSSPKRGLCFVPSQHLEDNAIWTTHPGSDLTWYYNYKYEPTPDYEKTPDLEFVPMLWGAPTDGDTSTPFLDSIRKQIKNGANITHVLGFNEPDGQASYGGSNISPEKAAAEWKRQMEPLKEQDIKLGAPAITGSPDGMKWLQDWLTHCDGGCNPDFLPVHFYGSFEAMASKIGEVTTAYPRLPVWVTEWGYSHQDLPGTQLFFNQSIQMFDGWSNVTRYSYFGAFRSDVSNVGPNAAMLTEKGELTDIGLPIGPNGEKVLAEAMSRLTAKSYAADLLWFGVGVRHIVRELVQTSQGCSLVALCAALTEAHSIPVSALVIYEIAKECGGPQELAPSLEQWEALIRVSASVFNGTTFGLRISQIAKVGMQEHERTKARLQYSHPTDVAKLLLSIGQIVHGTLQSVSVQGGCCCSWIAAWADFVLGLKVLVRDAHGNIVYANYNVEETLAHINIDFEDDEVSKRMLCVQSSHLLRSGSDFIQQCFGEERGRDSDHFFAFGRVQWETMLSDVFGTRFDALVRWKDSTTSPLRPFLQREAAMNQDSSVDRDLPEDEFLSEDQIFARLLAIVIIIIVTHDIPDPHNGSASRYFLRACEKVPELRQCY
ncbi:hypothetical protein N0V90_002165 [Kalmusia sp. IMI 367209]|nr:hypothetical protein N0V90_002165 [Kalmusia sp. IMI 367209]